MINCSGELHIVATKGRLNCVAERTTDVCHNLRGSCILNLDFNCAAFGHCICERINNAPSSSNRELISRTNCWIIYQTYLYSCCIRANLWKWRRSERYNSSCTCYRNISAIEWCSLSVDGSWRNESVFFSPTSVLWCWCEIDCYWITEYTVNCLRQGRSENRVTHGVDRCCVNNSCICKQTWILKCCL
jgi:hypothetical protein